MDYGASLRSKSRYAGMVKRYHAWPTIQQQTVADHTFHVLRIYMELWGCPEPVVLEHIVNHDLGELTAGDTPFPAKRTVPGLREAAEAAEQWGLEQQGKSLPMLKGGQNIGFKIADLLEMWEFAQVEVKLGNKLAIPIISNINHYLDAMDTSSHERGAINRYKEKFNAD